jgi:hypothetical protein
MKVYISSHDIEQAREVATALEQAGHMVVSNWHIGTHSMKRTADMTDEEMRDKSRANEGNIALCEMLVLISSQEKVPGGKFVEAGMALGMGKRVTVVGRYENMMLRHPRAKLVNSIEELVASLA